MATPWSHIFGYSFWHHCPSCQHTHCPDTCFWLLLDCCLSLLASTKQIFFGSCVISLFPPKASRTSCVVLLVTYLTLCTMKCTKTWISPSATTTLLHLTTHTWQGTSSFLSPKWICMHGCYKRAADVSKVSVVCLSSVWLVNRPVRYQSPKSYFRTN